MLAVVKKPHIELSINGENTEELIKWISKKFKIEIVNTNNSDDTLIPIEESNFYIEMKKNTVGNLLAGYRIKEGFTQKALADKAGIKQNMISDYENGKRSISSEMAKKFEKILNIKLKLS